MRLVERIRHEPVADPNGAVTNIRLREGVNPTPSLDTSPAVNEGPTADGAGRRPVLLGNALWWGILAATVIICLGNYSVMAQELRENSYFLAADFIVFWTASQAALPYDFEALTLAQRWYVESEALRPFAYPPSFLPWLVPFGLLPLLMAYTLWITATGGAFLYASSRIVSKRAALLGLAAPTTLLAMVPGQVTFLVGSMIIFGLKLLSSRPLLAGIFFGLAATIKPQALLLVPLALIASRQWQALGSSVITGIVVGLTCLAFQGVDVWVAWLRALPEFMIALDKVEILHFGITPSSAAQAAGVTGWSRQLFVLLGVMCGIFTVWRVFRRSDNVLLQLLALNISTLLILPYAMPYELALSAPVAAAMLLDRGKTPVIWLAALLTFTAFGKAFALAVMAAVLIAAVRRRPLPAASEDRSPPALIGESVRT